MRMGQNRWLNPSTHNACFAIDVDCQLLVPRLSVTLSIFLFQPGRKVPR